MPLWGHQGSSGLPLCLPGDCRMLCLSPSWLTHATLLIVPPLMQEHVTGCPFRHGVNRTEVLFPYIFFSNRSVVSPCLDFPGVPTPRDEGTFKPKDWLPAFAFSFLSALTQTQQLKTTVSCGSAIEAQDSQCLLLRIPHRAAGLHSSEACVREDLLLSSLTWLLAASGPPWL